MTKIILFKTASGPVTVVHFAASGQRAAITEQRQAAVQPEPTTMPSPVEGQPDITIPAIPVYETVEVTPAETEAQFHARLIAEIVPAGAQSRIVDADTLPPVSPEHWIVDWATGAISINGGSLLTDAKAQGKARLKARAAEIRKLIAETDDPVQLAGWAVKADIARRVKSGAGSVSDVTIIATEAGARDKGETPEQLADRILLWAEADALAAGKADGLQKAAEMAIDACTSPEQVPMVLATIESQAAAMVASEMTARTTL